MRDVVASFECDVKGIKFEVDIVCYGGAPELFADMWTMTDTHKGGVTITNPNAGHNSYAYGIPQQVSLAGLTSLYAKKGRDNPSQEAYAALQKKLERDIDCRDYGFSYSALVAGELITSGEVCGFGFDWSPVDNTDLNVEGQGLFIEHCVDDAVNTVAGACKRLVSMGDTLRGVGELYREVA